MRIPKTSRRPFEPLEELYLGRGDYVAGGARSLPFLDLDGARHRRPLVFGEVTDDMSSYPSLAAEMFSGRQDDPEEWAVMWKELGADGIAVDLHGDAELVCRISDRTRLPIVVRGTASALESLPPSEDSVMVAIGEYPTGTGHAVTATGSTADEMSSECRRLESSGEGRIVILVEGFAIGPRLPFDVSLVREIRTRALSGEDSLRHPVMADVTPCWDLGFEDARVASMQEAESALAAMMAGADMLIVRGPGAADMARVYGEELADL